MFVPVALFCLGTKCFFGKSFWVGLASSRQLASKTWVGMEISTDFHLFCCRYHRSEIGERGTAAVFLCNHWLQFHCEDMD